MTKIFFSWQADAPANVWRNFMDRALQRAIGAIAKDLEVEEALRHDLTVDRDTQGVTGTPSIVDTIALVWGRFDIHRDQIFGRGGQET